jgi:hypothetical protein
VPCRARQRESSIYVQQYRTYSAHGIRARAAHQHRPGGGAKRYLSRYLSATLRTSHPSGEPSPSDEAAKKARLADYEDFDGLRFVGKLGIEKGTGDYKDKNVLAEVITPDRKEWHAVEQVPAAKPSPASPATPIAKPAWAK